MNKKTNELHEHALQISKLQLKVLKVIRVEFPYTVYTLWSNGEERKNDFEQTILDYEEAGSDMFTPLRNWETFRQVSVSENDSLCWETVILTHKLQSGRIISGPLDVDADMLYAEGELVR